MVRDLGDTWVHCRDERTQNTCSRTVLFCSAEHRTEQNTKNIFGPEHRTEQNMDLIFGPEHRTEQNTKIIFK